MSLQAANLVQQVLHSWLPLSPAQAIAVCTRISWQAACDVYEAACHSLYPSSTQSSHYTPAHPASAASGPAVHSIQLRVPCWRVILSPALFQAGLCPLSLMACGDARLSDHMSPIYKFFAPFSSAATQGPLLPPVRCQHPHSSSVIGFPLCSLALLHRMYQKGDPNC